MTDLTVHASLSSYVRAVELQCAQLIDAAQLGSEQAALILAGLEAKRERAARKPLAAHSLAPVYFTLRAHACPVDAGAVQLGAGLMTYYFALDLFDSVQDDELEGAYAEAGPALAINCAIALHMLGQDALRRFACGLPERLRELAMAQLRTHALRSVRGQFRDLSARCRPTSAAEVRATSIDKSALSALRMELVGVYAASRGDACCDAVDPRYREIGDGVAELRQLSNDVADLFDGERSDDLRQGTMSMPLALYVELTGDAGRETLTAAQLGELDELQVQARIYASGAIARCAAQAEAVRVRIHQAFAELPCRGPYLALLLAQIDDIPSFYYRPPPLRIALDIDGVELGSMSPPDRPLLDALRARRQLRRAS